MKMYKELMQYYDSQELSVLQEEWGNLESHKYDSDANVCVDDLFDFWDKTYHHPDNNIFFETEKIKFTNDAPIQTEHFF